MSWILTATRQPPPTRTAGICLPHRGRPGTTETDLAQTEDVSGNEHEQLLESVPTDVEAQIVARRHAPR